MKRTLIETIRHKGYVVKIFTHEGKQYVSASFSNPQNTKGYGEIFTRGDTLLTAIEQYANKLNKLKKLGLIA